MSLFISFPSWIRDFSKHRDYGRQVRCGGDVSLIKSKHVCVFLFVFLPWLFFLVDFHDTSYILDFSEYGQEPEACKRALICLVSVPEFTTLYILGELVVLVIFIDNFIHQLIVAGWLRKC